MPQVNYTPIQLYRSGTAGNTPSASLMQNGELAINYADGKLFYKDGAGTVRAVVTPDGSVTTAKIADANVTPTKLSNSGHELGMRNRIINGGMNISQRGVSFSGLPSGGYALDRWSTFYSTSGSVTYSQQSDSPSNSDFQNSLRVSVGVADTSVAATDFLEVQQAIEGWNVRDLIGRALTLSFWVRSSKTGIHCVSFANSGTDRSFVAEYTVTVANTWEYKTITIPGGLITAGSWNWAEGAGLVVRFALFAGSNYQTIAGAWQTGNYLSTTNQVNVLDTAGNIFAITGVQLERGSTATPFEYRPYGTELALCQRYFEKIDVPAGQPIATLQAVSGSTAYGGFTPFKVTKRTGPTVAYSGIIIPWTAGGSSAGGSVVPYGIWPDGLNWAVSSASGLFAGNAVQLLSSGGPVVIHASAEL